MQRAAIVVVLVACGGGAGGDDAGTFDAAPEADAATCSDCVTTLPRDGTCAALDLAVDGTLAWSDRRCLPRETQLAGARARYFTITSGGVTRTSSGAAGYDGIGYVVAHLHAGGAYVNDGSGGAVEVLVDGAHHVVRRVSWTVPASTFGGSGGSARLVIDWFFATGRSHPVYAITYDLSGVTADTANCDSRSPYGEIRFDGDAGGRIGGIGWGDDHRYVTLGEPLDKLNGWDYTAANVVPYALEWITAGDAEMGLVGTEPQARKAGGGYWFYPSAGTRDDDGPMPEDFNWPYQLNQYSFASGETTDATRLAWGTNFGAVGQRSYAAYGDDPDVPPAGSPSGYPFQSYATFIVIGGHTEAVVTTTADEVATATTATTVTASVGTVRAGGPGGAGRTDTVAYQPPGHDPRYGVWHLDADAGAVEAVFHVDAERALIAPVVVIHGAAAAATVRLAGQLTIDDTDVFRSVDATTGDLWLTFHSAWRGDVTLAVSP